MDIQTFLSTAKYIEPCTSSKGLTRAPAIMVVGDHGMGKSSVIKHLIRKVLKFDEMYDRRLGQMNEGDLVGLPSTDGGVTKWNPPDFIRAAVERPVALFFDEVNRATREVLQSLFQIALDHEINGNVFHPGTRIFLAMNHGPQYQVTRMDPALRDRFWLVNLKPTVEDWLTWAKDKEQGDIHSAIVGFIKSADHYLVSSTATALENDQQPSPRSWEMLSNAMKLMEKEEGFDPINNDHWKVIFTNLATGFVGTSATGEFLGYIRKNGLVVSAEILLADFDAALIQMNTGSADKWADAVDRVLKYTETHELTENQCMNFGKFVTRLPAELRMNIWSTMAQQNGTNNKFTIHNVRNTHKYCRDAYLLAINGMPKKET